MSCWQRTTKIDAVPERKWLNVKMAFSPFALVVKSRSGPSWYFASYTISFLKLEV